MGLGMKGGSPPGPDLVLTPPSSSEEVWAPSSSFSRFCCRTQGSERLLCLGLFTPLWGEEKRCQPDNCCLACLAGALLPLPVLPAQPV